MEKLKLLLKKVLSEGASQAILKMGEQAKIVVQQGRVVQIPDFGAVDQAWIDELYKALFPREGLALLSQQLVRSQFNIVNVGKVNAIADPRAPKTLYLFFPPNGDALSQDQWAALSPPAKQVDVTPPPPPPEPATLISNPPSAAGSSTISQAIKGGTSPTQAAQPNPPAATNADGAPAVTQIWQVIDATGSVKPQIDVPNEVQTNKDHLALLISSDQAVIAKLKAAAEALKLFPFITDNDAVCYSVLDRVHPKLIVLDEKIAKFEAVLKKIYDMEMEKRSQVTALLLSKTFATGDTKVAFAYSVDGVMNRERMDGLELYIRKIDANRKTTFQAWADHARKV